MTKFKKYIIEIKRNKCVEPNDFVKHLTNLLSDDLLGNIFEVFENETIRNHTFTPVQRIFTIDSTNTITGAKIVDLGLNPDLDLYYASVLIPDDVDFKSTGVFKPRALMDKKGNYKLICLDYIMNWGDKYEI